MSEMTYRGLGRYYCPDDAPGLTAEQIAKHNARAKPLLIKNAKAPLHQSENSDYLMSEAALFRIIVDQVGVNTIVDQNGARASNAVTALSSTPIGLCGLYLSDILNDGRRPQWLAQAQVKVLALADLSVARQVGGLTTDVAYGAISDGGSDSASTIATAACGRLLLRAYSLSGSTAYLTAADNCAHFLRRMQRIDTTPVFAVDDASVPQRMNGFALSVTPSSGLPSGILRQGGAYAISFFNDLRAIRGGSYVYGDAVAGIQATVDTIISDAIGFYFGGTFRGTPLFSTTAPYAMFTSKLSNGSGTNTFDNFTVGSVQYNIAAEFAYGVRALFDVEGYSTRVASYMDWLQSFTGYDTTLAPSLNLAVQTKTAAPISTTISATYGLQAAGMLAPVVIAGSGSIRALKDAMAAKRKMTASTVDSAGRKNGVGFPYASIYTGPTGRLGFDMTAPLSTINLTDAAVLGGIYRLSPRAQDTIPDGFAEQIGAVA